MGGGPLPLGEREMPAFGVDMNGVAAAELAAEDLLRQRVLQLLLDRALERTRAVHRVEADIAQQVEKIAQMAEENSAAAQSTSETSEEMEKLAQELHDIVVQYRV